MGRIHLILRRLLLAILLAVGIALIVYLAEIIANDELPLTPKEAGVGSLCRPALLG